MAYLLQQIANAAPVAALYAALAFGYSIAFAVTRRADITYGALFAFAGQTFVLFSAIGWSGFKLVLPAALALGAAAGIAYAVAAGALIGRHVMRPLAFASGNAVVVAAVGLVLALMETARLAAGSRNLWLPPLLSRPLVLWNDPGFPVVLTLLQALNIAAMAGIVAAGHLFLAYSRWGRHWRAVAGDRLAAELCGVDSRAVFVAAYAGATLVASLAGILATAYYGTMDFGAGLVFGVKVLFVAAIGGAGRPLRAALGGAAMGLAETLWSAYGPILWRDPVVISGLVLLLALFRGARPVP